ncbi:Peroxin-3 [Cercophora newfieldiana]|uniref:Peroxin-3 n=1 Tax=Cercophora newfieldiana TaxID=92897 RepID=A0AA39Y4M2_9PEZI|nr:Peroxin-3 [Cercophora newfieldiana]
MFGATRRWFRRNRTPIAIGVGVVGAGYVVTQYVLSKINDARERMSSDRIAKENLRRRFEQNQEDCTFTVLALLPTATTNILEAMNTEKITYEIQQMKGSAAAKTRSVGSLSPPTASEAATTDDDGRSTISVSVQSEAGVQTSQISIPPMTPAASVDGAAPEAPQTPQKPRKTKRQLWDDLTISSITRAYTLIYTLGLLAMLTRIQLNLLGRRSYLSSVVSLATGGTQATISLENNDDDGTSTQAYGSDFDVNRKYLTFSWWLLNRGWVDVMQRVEAAVRQVFGHLSPRDTVSLETFSRLTSEVRRRVEGSSPGSGSAGTQWLPFLLPPASMEDFVLRESGILDDAPPSTYDLGSAQPSPSSSASLRLLLDETADLIESPAFGQVLTQLLDAAFAVLLTNKLAAGAFEPPLSSELRDPLSGAGYSRAVLLPKILSVLTRQAHVIGNGMPNEYLQAMEAVRDLEGFAAIVYSSNWQAEIARDGEAQAAARAPGTGNTTGAASVPATESSTLQQSQVSGGESSLVVVDPQSSLVVVDPQASFDSAWEKAVAQK